MVRELSRCFEKSLIYPVPNARMASRLLDEMVAKHDHPRFWCRIVAFFATILHQKMVKKLSNDLST